MIEFHVLRVFLSMLTMSEIFPLNVLCINVYDVFYVINENIMLNMYNVINGTMNIYKCLWLPKYLFLSFRFPLSYIEI